MTCPICGKPAANAFRPFCSRRCADIDLGRWLTGAYRLAGDELAAAEDQASEAPETKENADGFF